MSISQKLTYGIKKDIENCIYDWINNKHGVFSWVDDSLFKKSWYYNVHVSWVSKWNESGRVNNMEVFLLEWLRNTDYIKEVI